MTVRPFPAAASAVLAVAALFSLIIPTIDAENTQLNLNESQFQWRILSTKNFSTHIHLHPHILLLVTVPWCGESRSLMRKISLKMAEEQQKYSSLVLMLVYRNVDKELADSLGVVEDIAVLCYHHAVSYKYKGSLRVPDILSSVRYITSHVPDDLPLRKINNSEDMKMFLASTDKAVLLFETCGWASKLLTQFTANKTVQALQVLRDLNKETNRTHTSGWNSKYDVGSELMISEVEDRCDRSPWVGKFSAENGTSFPRNATSVVSCNFDEYKKFESFFSKFIAAARDAFLPPQRQRYALVSDSLLLSPLSIEVSDIWSLIISYSGCPSCVKKIKEETTYLQDTLEMHDQPVIELQEDENGLGPSLPTHKPSVVLFVDRLSESKKTARKSQEALLALKEFAQQHWRSHQTDGQSNERPRKPHTEKGSAATYGNRRLVLSSASDKIKDKMSIVIIKDGQYVTLDDTNSELQSSSLHEILTKLVEQKKHSKLSSLAKEAGFRLLSDDIDIKITNVLSPQIGTHKLDSAGNLDEASTNIITSPPEAGMEHVQPAYVEPPLEDTEPKSPEDLSNIQIELDDSHRSFKVLEVVSSTVTDSETQAFVEANKSETLKDHFNRFTGSFFYSDGNNVFLKSLTNDLEVPSMVIIDPVSQQHYVFSGETTFNLSSISTIIDRFLNGSLIPYQRSGPLQKTIEMSYPPFVNLDFHEKDAIPSVTTDTFLELVIGNGQSDAHNLTNAWNKDVVVLFSSTSCGFCQKMELVVREVYRALKGYMNLVKCDSKDKELRCEDAVKDVISKLPAIYSIDCILNDCRWILKSAGHREVYPSLLLFAANKKTVIPFDGNMIVTDVISFLANHGVNSEHIVRQKATLWTEGGENDNHDVSRDTFSNMYSPENSKCVGITDMKLQNQMTLEPDAKEASRDLVVGSFLVASERLNGINPFSEAKILIVSANPDSGFQGLILNKPIGWNHVLGSESVDFLREAPISFGGPVIQDGRPLVSLTRSSFNHQYTETLPDVYFLDPSETINIINDIQAGNKSASEYWFFWGWIFKLVPGATI